MFIVGRFARVLGVMCTAVLLMLGPSSAQASSHIIYVDADATGTDDGSTWGNAYPTLHEALAAATSGNQIWVAEGIYYPDEGLSSAPADPREATFQLLVGVEIYGGFDGSESQLSERNPATHITVLSGDLDQDDTFDDGNGADPVVTTYGGIVPDATGSTGTWANNSENAYQVTRGNNTDSTTILSGFTITAGLATGSLPNNVGGGMYIKPGSPTLMDLTFSGNQGVGGGGIWTDGATPTLTNITFTGNRANSAGGGMGNTTSSPKLTNVTFSGNSSTVGGGMYNVGGSIPTLTNVTFVNNMADEGGGMYNTSSSATLTNAAFIGNSATEGGGMHNANNSDLAVINVTFTGNTAVTLGGGIYNDLSDPVLTNATFSSNTANLNGGGMYNTNSSNPFIQNSILWGNTNSSASNQIVNNSSTPTISYSLIEGSGGSTSWDTSLGTDGGSNIDTGPLFTDADGVDNISGTLDDDLSLQASSPAIDTGNNNADLDNTVGGDTISDVPLDLAGNPRITDGPDVDTTAIIDMGAYEWQPPLTGSPTNLSASYNTANAEIELNWTDGVTNETAYTVERRPDGGLWLVLDDMLPADSNSYVDTHISCGTTYDYRVTATNSVGASPPSNVASIDVLCPVNGGFEDPLNEWATSSNANRYSTGLAYDGGAVMLLNNPGSLDFARQTVTIGGTVGDVVTLSFYVGGQNVPSGGFIGGRVELLSGGTVLDTANCLYTGSRGTFNWKPVTCDVTASGTYDAIRVTVGAQNVNGGFIGFDAVDVTQN